MKLRAIAVLLILGWFLAFAGDGLKSWFTDDDLMNLYGATDRTWVQLAKDNVLFFLGKERPLTAVVYKALFGVFGFNPQPYRVVCFVVLAANLVLAMWLFARLSGSDGTALLGGLLLAYHACLSDLYLSTGTMYDSLCFTLYFAALGWYVGIRLAGRAPRWGETLGLCVLTVLAMNAKEMAVTLPLMLAATEWWFGDRRHWRTVIVCAIPAGLLAAGRLFSPADTMSWNPAYQADFRWSTYVERWRHYTRMLLYQGDEWNGGKAIAFLAGCVLLAWLARRREARWAAVLALAGALPVSFILPRSMYAIYLALPGFCLLGASVADALVKRAWPRGNTGTALAAGTLALWLWPMHVYFKPWNETWYTAQASKLKGPGEALRRGLPKLPSGKPIYFVDDPFPIPPDDNYSPVFLVRLITGDHTIGVERAKTKDEPVPEKDWGNYSAVFRLTRDKLERLR